MHYFASCLLNTTPLIQYLEDVESRATPAAMDQTKARDKCPIPKFHHQLNLPLKRCLRQSVPDQNLSHQNVSTTKICPPPKMLSHEKFPCIKVLPPQKKVLTTFSTRIYILRNMSPPIMNSQTQNVYSIM